MSARASTLCPFVVLVACATAPLDAPRGELRVVSDTGDAQIKAIELQHQQYTHAESIAGFESGHDEVLGNVLAGPYCVERMLFDTGPVGGVVMPQNMCFEVVAHEPTEIRVFVTETGRIGMQSDRAIAGPGGPPIAAPD